MLRISVVTALMALIGCASAPTDPTVFESAVPVLWEVRLYDDADEAIVELVGIEDPVYSTFRMDDPRKVVLEYEGAVGSTFVPPSPSSMSLVEEVMVSELGEAENPVTRIEFSLKSPAVFEVMEGTREFAFRVIPLAEGMTADSGVMMQPLASDESADDESDDSEPVPSDEPEMVLAPEAPDATQISALRVEPVEGGLLVHVDADGSIRAPESFVIEDPARLVIDLPGVSSALENNTVELDSPFASRVRVGVHPDKLRLVFDGNGGVEAFDGRWVIPTRDGLLVTFGQSESVTAAVESAMSPEWVAAEENPTGDDEEGEGEGEATLADASDSDSEEAGDAEPVDEEMTDEEWISSSDTEMAAETEAPASLPVVTIHSVSFMGEAGLDRIVISSDQPIEAHSFEPDADTLILRFENAMMGSGDKVRIAPEEHGPVSLVTAFDQPEMDTPEVR
ncbi:MAG: AMIN domain-containing protein, partial [Deltaproteobacteria bacterium]|nr:AMIN domain-containing protein [Deltaproteobacteria bacterium]